jgi:glycosyltransferase involved in cell wall biosynthesis
MPPSVSIIIPTFNRAAFLKEAVDSVCAQTTEDWELIVVDDGSTDDTPGVMAAFRDPRIRYVSQARGGVAAARNSGVALSRASLIAFLDSDDLWLPEKLRFQFQFFSLNPAAAICQTEEMWIRRGQRVNPRVRHRKHSGWIFKECLPLCIVSPSAVMMRLKTFDVLGGFDETLPACEDYDLWLRASLRYEIHTLSQMLTVKRGGHADQLSRQWGLDRWRIAALEKILADPALAPEYVPLVVREIARRCQILAAGASKRGNIEMCREYEGKAARAEVGLRDQEFNGLRFTSYGSRS